MKTSSIFKSSQNFSIQSDFIVDGYQLMNNTTENYHPSYHNLSSYNTQSNTYEHTQTFSNQRLNSNSIITKKISIKNINKNRYIPSIINFTNIASNLSQKIFLHKRKNFVYNLILIQSVVKAFLFRKKFNKSKIFKKTYISKRKKQKRNIKSIKIKFKISICSRSKQISTNHFITKNIIKNKIIDIKKIILIQKTFRKLLASKTKSLISCLKNIFYEYEDSIHRRKAFIYRSNKKTKSVKEFFNKKSIGNKNAFLMVSKNLYESSFKNRNKENINTVISLTENKYKKFISKISKNNENDDLIENNLVNNFNISTNTDKNIKKKQYNKIKIKYNLNKNVRIRNYVYSHKQFNTINEKNNGKRKAILSETKSRNSQVYSKKKIKFLDKEQNYCNSEKKIKIYSNLSKTLMCQKLNIINYNKKNLFRAELE